MNQIMKSIHEIIGDIYGQIDAATCLHPWSWKEPHLLLYQREKEKEYVTSCLLKFSFSYSFTVLTSIVHSLGTTPEWKCITMGAIWHGKLCFPHKTNMKEEERTFGHFDKLSNWMAAGQVLVHPGDLYHRGGCAYHLWWTASHCRFHGWFRPTDLRWECKRGQLCRVPPREYRLMNQWMGNVYIYINTYINTNTWGLFSLSYVKMLLARYIIGSN
jgi:hypothetical protein